MSLQCSNLSDRYRKFATERIFGVINVLSCLFGPWRLYRKGI